MRRLPKLNKITVQDPYPLPRVDDILMIVATAMLFSLIDLKQCFWQLGLHALFAAKTAFSTQDGHFEFKRMPFGLKNAPAACARMVQRILGDLPFVQAYADDICVFSDDFDTHIQHLLIVFDRLNEANLKINWEKCRWFQQKVKILGHVVSHNSIMMDPQKIEVILEMLPPTNLKQLQKSLGMFGYYRRYIQDFADIAKPLYVLMKKGVMWLWTTIHAQAFNELKQHLIKYPILRQPNDSLRFYLFTDASQYAIGCVLGQKDGDIEYVIQYGSRLLKGAEIHYGITEKECLAVVLAVKLCRTYLYGMPFSVVTDHSALTWLLRIPEPTGRLARWALYLQMFSPEIQHRKGVLHSNVDPLSRPVLMVNTRQGEKKLRNTEVTDDQLLMTYLKTNKHRNGISTKQVKRIEKLASQMKFENDSIWYKHGNGKTLEWPRIELRQLIVERAHLLGHFQVETTLKRLQDSYYWRKMIDDVRKVIERCDTCKRFEHSKVYDHPARALPITGLFDRVGIDLIFGLKETSHGYRGIMVITEYLSKYPVAMPIVSKTATEIASRLFEYISMFGPPKELLSDQGKEFLNSIVSHISLVCGVERKVTAAYHPRTNGLTERFNGTLVNSLIKHTENEPDSWPEWLPFILFAYRTRVHSTTQQTPLALLTGQEANKFQSWTSTLTNQEEEVLQRAGQLKKLIENTRPNTIAKLQVTQEAQKATQNANMNVRTCWPMRRQYMLGL